MEFADEVNMQLCNQSISLTMSDSDDVTMRSLHRVSKTCQVFLLCICQIQTDFNYNWQTCLEINT